MAKVAISRPAARGIPQYGQPGYIGPETAFFGKYAATGGKKPGYTTTTYKQPSYIGDISAQQASAKKANIERQKRIESLFDMMSKMVQPGGAFEKRGLGEIEAAKTKGVGKEMQQMVSSGMYGTTTAAGVERGWEADVGAPARLRLEDIMQQRQLGVMGQKAGFLERIEDVYPDYSSLLQMLAR